jgi:malonyl-CoA/methylmalonyl-CoA synthetase
VAGAILEASSAPRRAERPALVCEGVTVSHRQLARLARSAAGRLGALGVRRGDVVAMAGDASIPYVAHLLGTLALGAVHLPLEAGGMDALARRLRAVEAKLVVADRGFRARLAPECRLPAPVVPLEAGLRSEPSLPAELGAEEGAFLLFTSGSTGEPKPVLLSHGNVLNNAAGVAERTRITAADRVLCCMPLYHTNALNNQVVAPLLAGAAVVLHRRFHPERLFDWVAAERATYFTAVPTMFRRLLEVRPPPGALRTVRFVRGGAAAFSEDLHARVERHLGVPLVVSWGLTEATCTSAMNPPQAVRPGTVGTALAGQEVAVLALGEDRVLGPDREGEVAIRGANVAPQFGTGWLRTGDVGRLDGRGYLRLVGRRKHVIDRGGENVYPEQVEAVLAAHPAVAGCCVVGLPDREYGEVPVACVVVREGADREGRLPAELRELAVRGLPRPAVPTHVVRLEGLPVNGAGKIDRRAARGLAWEALRRTR